MINTILEFAFETGDIDCPYYQVRVIAHSTDFINYEAMEDLITQYMEYENDEDAEYEVAVEDIMNGIGLSWSLVNDVIPESRAIFTFFI